MTSTTHSAIIADRERFEPEEGGLGTLLAFLLSFAGFALVAYLQGEKQFFADSAEYWGLSETFVQEGHFSLLNYSSDLRGYSLPLTYHFARTILEVFTSSDSQMVMVFNAALFSVIGAVLAPRFAQVAWPTTRWGVSRRLAICGVLLIFWRGYLNYPLSDFPALAAALLALIAVSHADSPLWMLVAGLSSGLAMNYRPAYVLLIPILVSLVVWEWFRQHDYRHAPNARRASCAALFITGLAVIAIPQSLSQHHAFGNYSPLAGSRLASVQYNEGLVYQRLDAMVTPDAKTLMIYDDPHTEGIIASRDGRAIDSTGEYLGLIVEHPVTMSGVFLRHVVNALDQRFPTPYVEHLEGTWNKILRVAGFLLVFVAFSRFLWPAARRSLEPARWRYPVALLLITIPSLPSAAVNRLMLPVFLLCSLLVLAPGWPNPLALTGQGLHRYAAPGLMLGAGVLFYVLVSAIVGGASDNLHLVRLE